MLDYLEQLIKEQKWEEALVLAERSLLNQENTVEDQLRINLALITARSYLGEYSGIVLLGEHAARMAADLENWDAFLTINHYLGHALSVLNQWADAKGAWLDFVAALPLYGRDHLFEVVTWFHLGCAADRENDLDSAVAHYLRASQVAERNGNGRQVLGINHALIHTYTKQGKFDKVPILLAKAARYLRNNRLVADWEKAKLSHLQVRASFALATNRFQRAKLIATRALAHPKAAPIHQFHIHMILATVAKSLGNTGQMVDHYLKARVAAIRARRYDFEVDAAETLYEIVQLQPKVLEMSLADLVSRDIPAAWFEMD